MTHLLKNFNADNFKDSEVAEAVRALAVLQTKFEENKGARLLTGILVQMGRVFPADQTAIIATFGQKSAAQAKPPIKNKMVEVKLNQNTLDKSKIEQPCATCPGGSEYGVKVEQEITGQEGTAADAEDDFGQQDPETSLADVKTWRDVLSIFQSNIKQMAEFAKANGIKAADLNTAGDYAKAIYQHLVNESSTK